eukprot:437939-Rhodomonas_salina.1
MIQDGMHNSTCDCGHIACQGFMGPEVAASRIHALRKRKAQSRAPVRKRRLFDNDTAGVAALLCTMAVTSASQGSGRGAYVPEVDTTGSPLRSPACNSTRRTPQRGSPRRGAN